MSNSSRNWFTITEPNDLDTPALLIYPERIKYNLKILKGMVDDVSRLRPHVKTHKCREVVLFTIAAGINKFKCATIAEAEMLGMCLAKDVLLAYQPIGSKLNRFIKLIKKYPETQFSCLVDNVQSVHEIAKAATEAGELIYVYIDLNVGMDRTGVKPDVEALRIYLECMAEPSIRPIGLHAYDGHIRDSDIKVRTQRCDEWFQAVEKLQRDLIRKDRPDPIIIAGGTTTFAVHAKRKKVECSPGTFIYMDAGYLAAFSELNFLPAATVVTRITSQPGKNSFCLDLGHKSIASENPLDKRVSFLDGHDLVPVSQSEEHLVVDAPVDHLHKVGDFLYVLPYHICPTVALYEKAVTVEENKITGKWPTTARDRQLTI